MAAQGRPGAMKKTKKGPTKGSGGKGRRSLEGKGPTPKAEDRVYHKAYQAKQDRQKKDAAGRARRHKRERGVDTVAGRNSVLEALRQGIPATALYVAHRIESDDRVREIIALAAEQGISMLEATKPDLDRLTDDAIHQGVALQVPPYSYAHPDDLLELAAERFETPLLVALDGITDPRNLGAIVRSTAAFGGHGVIIPERRAASMTAAAWKTSAGAASRIPVAQVVNLARALQELKKQGVFVLGLDMDGDVELPSLSFAKEPICIVVGSEGKGISRLIGDICDQIVSIPISAATESLNAGIAAAVTLYEVAKNRAQ
ncbi:23S rRNA (guanosine(2251)-2'-O)-methyltransferase RlmB [Brevibacterium sp. 50QC2O2]|jgi:23S rRNA (guanosine2251-2'-O)-methyltransferase|uniref:23S rRNA (guanosine(2251)-2'-O)-methyltransferase RlmB n=1 Tax=Brevibacterium TaxID=1696 RepID=UPI00211BA95D|nr:MULTISPECIES: 23S rRNA (guanosine(2251)-2'-O)-methyltransferase RlmB [unclassified Brevibacterium]MCQ9368949.1 23S rRNA (guanosine(2251)-2'-O)-methyltransferase RlmB [Brevibacterium sp. 91QC2O2]MCQ9385976.1 23S rRNA (guanosine(2251)-2'-O)-methyltransferase RlmB [Brevibacterium sp. 68QC2CO]MCQ9387733.1 23S rRNA (guanosine(2251)-2'-O)-methyltransferase RlmB [Brevibacterium sp. 50QC2O2]